MVPITDDEWPAIKQRFSGTGLTRATSTRQGVSVSHSRERLPRVKATIRPNRIVNIRGYYGSR